ncbi:Subunit of heteropentameric Replication factor C (RF-C) [Hanseniaspora vineae]
MSQQPLFKKQKISAPVENKPWVEKYRPANLDEITAQDHAVQVLKSSLKTANLPHMLFYGPPGTGKTSTILALTKELFGPRLMKTRVLELNASDERGISIVREKVKSFAGLTVSKPSKEDLENYACPPYKIVILDEADSMTADAQAALRRTMETYSNVTRFCLICNYVTRIIDPLASRCSKFRFKPLDSFNALSRLEYIAEQEDVVFSENLRSEVCTKILNICDGDLRKAITLLQSASKINKQQGSDGLTEAQVDELAGVIPESVLNELIGVIKTKKANKIIAYIKDFMNQGYSISTVVSQLHNYYFVSEKASDLKNNNEIDWLLFETDSRLTNGTNEHIQFLNLALNLAQQMP